MTDLTVLPSPCQFKVINIVTASTKATISIFVSIDCRICKDIQACNQSGNSNVSNEDEGKETEENCKEESKIVENDGQQKIENRRLICLGNITIHYIQRNPIQKYYKKKCISFNCKQFLCNKKHNNIMVKRSKRSESLLEKSDSVLRQQYVNMVDDASEMLNDYDSSKNNIGLNVTNSGQRCKKVVVRRRKLEIPTSRKLNNEIVLELSLQPTTVHPATSVLGRKIVIIKKRKQKHWTQPLMPEKTNTITTDINKINRQGYNLSYESEENILPVTLSNNPKMNSSVCTKNIVYKDGVNNFTTSNKNPNHPPLQSIDMPNLTFRGPVRIVRMCVNRKLWHFGSNEPISESTKKCVAVHANWQKFELEIPSGNLEEAAGPSSTKKKRRRKKKDCAQRQRNQSRKSMPVIENQKNTLAQSLLSQQSKMVIKTVVPKILDKPSDVPTMLSSNQESDKRKFADVTENAIHPTPVPNSYIENITRTNLAYEITTSIQHETIVRTRTYTYIVDRVHDDYHQLHRILHIGSKKKGNQTTSNSIDSYIDQGISTKTGHTICYAAAITS